MIITRQDLTDPEVVKDALADFRRLQNDEALLAWAKRWAEPALNALRRRTGLLERDEY